MAVTSFVRQPKGRSVSMTDAGIWEVREIWQATFDGEYVDPLDFLGDPMLPSLGEEHPNNSYLRLKLVTNGTPPSDGSMRALNFTLLWTTNRLPDTKHEADKFVDGDRRTVSWGHRIITEPVEKAFVADHIDEDTGEPSFREDADGNPVETPIESTEKERMIPGIERNRYLPVCRYSRNELIVPFDVLELPGYVNEDDITLDGRHVPAGTALISAASVSQEKRFEDWEFRTVDYEFMLNPDGWDEKLLNRGFFCVAAREFSFRDDDGNAFYVWLGKEACMIPNGSAEEAIDRPYVQTPEPATLNIDGLNLTKWTSAPNWVPDPNQPGEQKNIGGAGLDEDDFVPHYRTFRHLTRTSFAAWGFY